MILLAPANSPVNWRAFILDTVSAVSRAFSSAAGSVSLYLPSLFVRAQP